MFIPILAFTLLVGCYDLQTGAVTSQPTQIATPIAQDTPAPPTSTQVDIQPQPEATQPQATAGAECLGEEDNRIGRAIDAEYENASYEQVMSWFCNGAEFEDIMTALQTEEQTGTPAEEMLVMLANGFTWEEIWQVIGLTE